jgi:hypothetical protein
MYRACSCYWNAVDWTKFPSHVTLHVQRRKSYCPIVADFWLEEIAKKNTHRFVLQWQYQITSKLLLRNMSGRDCYHKTVTSNFILEILDSEIATFSSLSWCWDLAIKIRGIHLRFKHRHAHTTAFVTNIFASRFHRYGKVSTVRL